jgi:hypothetical protein
MRGFAGVKRRHFIPIIDSPLWPGEDATRDRSNRLLDLSRTSRNSNENMAHTSAQAPFRTPAMDSALGYDVE